MKKIFRIGNIFFYYKYVFTFCLIFKSLIGIQYTIFFFKRVHFTKYEEFGEYIKSQTKLTKKNKNNQDNSTQLKLNNIFPNSRGLKQLQFEDNLTNFIINSMKSLSTVENDDFNKLIFGSFF